MDSVRPPQRQNGRSRLLPRRRLYTELGDRMIKSKFAKTPFYFLPQSDLDEIITEERVRAALQLSSTDRQLLEFILGKAKKVFAIAAYTELDGVKLRNAMSFFCESNFDDSKLPIEEISGQEIRKQEELCYERLAMGLGDYNEDYNEEEMATKAFDAIRHPLIASEVPVRIENDRIWTRDRILKFQDAQESFLAPVLSEAESNHDLYGHTLPFITKHGEHAAGSFGEVSKYTIHESHILRPERPNAVRFEAFAVKEIKTDNNADRKKVSDHWASEVRAMAMMNKLDHKGHIVRFVTAFRRDVDGLKEHYLITEWADGGNLQNLWEERAEPKLNAVIVKSVIGQLLGIAEAFNAAHNLKSGDVITGASYRHGDLKPANILWFRPKSGDENDIGTLKICDWGEAKNKQSATVMRHSRTTAEFGTRRYQPPEVETGVSSMIAGDVNKRRSRLYDIWAVGCITLEFLVWLLYGYEGLKVFTKGVRNELNIQSPFYQIRDRGIIKIAWVHNVVARWMEHMATDEACRIGMTALGDLLEIVKTGLLVVDLPSKGGTFNEQDSQAIDILTQPRLLSLQDRTRALEEEPAPATPRGRDKQSSLGRHLQPKLFYLIG